MKDDYFFHRKCSLSSIVFVIYCFYYISGYSSLSHNYIILGLFLIWNFFAYLEDNKAYNYSIGNKCFLWLLLFVLYYFFTSLIVADLIYVLKYVTVFLFIYSTIIQYKYYYYRNNFNEIFFIVKMVIIAYLIFSISAIRFYILNPSAARVLAADFYAFDNIAIGGGYSIAFGASIFSVYLFEILIKKKFIKKKFKLYFLICFILFELLLIKTESTTTLIANLFGLSMCVIIKYYSSGVKNLNKIIYIAILILIFLVIALNINNIGGYIVDITFNGTENVLIRRFNRIGLKLKFMGVQYGYTNYVDERFGTILTSWNTFLKHPIFGVGYKCGNIFSLLESYGVGTHSELVDVLAQHGLIGFIFWLMFILNSIKSQNNYLKCNGWKFTLLIMLVFNPFRSFHGFIVIFFLIPMMNNMIQFISLMEGKIHKNG